jgi:hypothetical protein
MSLSSLLSNIFHQNINQDISVLTHAFVNQKSMIVPERTVKMSRGVIFTVISHTSD